MVSRSAGALNNWQATLKQAGLQIEATQLESVEAIERLTVLALSVAVRILQLVEGRENTALPASVAFTSEQQHCLEQLAPTLQGRTSITAEPLSPCLLTLGNLANCSSRWMVGVSVSTSPWNGYKECMVCGSLSLSSSDGNSLRLHLCVHGSPWWEKGQLGFICFVCYTLTLFCL